MNMWYSRTSISAAILDRLCSFPYKWTSINGEVGNGEQARYPRLMFPIYRGPTVLKENTVPSA